MPVGRQRWKPPNLAGRSAIIDFMRHAPLSLRRVLALLGALAPLALAAQPALAPGEVLVERVMLPDARAGSFAFGLPGGVNICYDPVRGGVNYAWTGGFLDIANVRPVNKLIKPAVLLGPVVESSRETVQSPLRRGDPKHVPKIEFKGYTLRPRAVELRYTVDDTPVTEIITASPRGDSFTRSFRFDAASADAKWWFMSNETPTLLNQLGLKMGDREFGFVQILKPYSNPEPPASKTP